MFTPNFYLQFYPQFYPQDFTPNLTPIFAPRFYPRFYPHIYPQILPPKAVTHPSTNIVKLYLTSMIESQKCKAQAINTLDLNKGKSAGAKQILEQLLRKPTLDNQNNYDTITQMPPGHI